MACKTGCCRRPPTKPEPTPPCDGCDLCTLTGRRLTTRQHQQCRESPAMIYAFKQLTQMKGRGLVKA